MPNRPRVRQFYLCPSLKYSLLQAICWLKNMWTSRLKTAYRCYRWIEKLGAGASGRRNYPKRVRYEKVIGLASFLPPFWTRPSSRKGRTDTAIWPLGCSSTRSRPIVWKRSCSGSRPVWMRTGPCWSLLMDPFDAVMGCSLSLESGFYFKIFFIFSVATFWPCDSKYEQTVFFYFFLFKRKMQCKDLLIHSIITI